MTRFTIEHDLKKFNRWTSSVLRGMERDAQEKFLRAIALEAVNRIMKRNPVDTGRSRAGWSAVPGADPGTGDGAAEGAALSQWNTDFSGPVQWVEVVNGVEYTVFLEFGSSDQAPAGMVRVSLAEIEGRPLDEEALAALNAEIRKADRKAGWSA